MKKILKEYEVQFLDNENVFTRGNFDQYIGQGLLESVSYEDKNGDVVTYTSDDEGQDGARFKALVTQQKEVEADEEAGVEAVAAQFELNLVGVPVDAEVTLVGADAGFLTDSKDVYRISSKGLPVPPVIHDVIRLDDKKI